jgi:hypothetical protein
MNKNVLFLVLGVLFFSTNIHAKNIVVNINAGEVSVVGTPMNVPDLERWYYFSFATGDTIGSSEFVLTEVNPGKIGTEVPDANWATRTDWDIAFHSTDIRTNGAKAKLIADSTSATPLADVYAALLNAPDGDYSADEVTDGTFIQSLTAGMPPQRATQMSVCPVTHGWATFGMSAVPTNSMVVVFELADDRYVKVYLKDFFNEEGNPGYIDMEYELFNNDEEGNPSVIDVNDGDYPDYSRWSYFSFATGEIVGTSDFTLINVVANIGTEIPNGEWAARTDWDIAFHASDIRTNDAEAVLVADATVTTPLEELYAGLIQAPSEGYEADGTLLGTFYQKLFPMPPVRTTEISGCKATHGWASLGMGGNTEEPRIVVFKLKNGKYVKVFLKSFFDDEDKGGFIDMEYAEISAPGNTGINHMPEIKFSIYPNPATEIVHVTLVNPATIVIYNMNGAIVKQVRAGTGVNAVSVANLTAGIYFVKVNNQVRKLIVK